MGEEKSPMMKRERDHCVSGIRAKGNREKSSEEMRKGSVVRLRTNENREKSHEGERKRSVRK